MSNLFSKKTFDYLAGHPWVLGQYCLLALLACLAVLAILHFVPRNPKRYLVIGMTFVAGLLYAVEYFWPPKPNGDPNPLTPIADVVGSTLQVVAAFTFLLGIYNLLHIHTNAIRRRRTNWVFSLVFFVAFFAMVTASFWRDWYQWFGPPLEGPPGTRTLQVSDLPPDWILDRNTLEPEVRERLGLGPVSPTFNPLYASDLYTILFRGLYINLEATMFSILAFYIVSAAYRAFRVRSAEAGLMMLTAVILMAGQVPLGMALTSWLPASPADAFPGLLRIENFSYWVLSVINMPVQRAIEFGLGLGALAMALRIWLSLERGSYFGSEV